MKRFLKSAALFAVSFVAAGMLAGFSGCERLIGGMQPGGEQPAVEGLEDAVVEDIRQAYLKEVCKANIFNCAKHQITVLNYCGTYGEYIVAEIRHAEVGTAYTMALVDREIGDIYIDYVPDPTYNYWAYHVGENRISLLQKAYDEGAVTRNDLLEIAYTVNGEAYEAKKEEIKQAYRNSFLPDGDVPDVSIVKYLGTYRSCIVVELSDGSEIGEENTDVIIDGIRIDSVPASVSVWAYDANGWYWDANPTGSLLPLEKVYERGYLTESNLLNMSYWAETQKKSGGER